MKSRIILQVRNVLKEKGTAGYFPIGAQAVKNAKEKITSQNQ